MRSLHEGGLGTNLIREVNGPDPDFLLGLAMLQLRCLPFYRGDRSQSKEILEACKAH